MSSKVKYPNDTVTEILREASVIQTLAKTVLKTTSFEGKNCSESISQNVVNLRTSMDEVLVDLQNLKVLYNDIDNKKSEMEKNIKLSERLYLAFQKEEISKLTTVKKDYETKVNLKQAETKRNEMTAKREAEAEITRKEKERNKLINDTEREVTRTINEAERTKNNKIKQLSTDLDKVKRDALKDKEAKVGSYNSNFDAFMKEINDLKGQLSKKEEELMKIAEKIKAGKTDLKDNENSAKSEIKQLKETITLKESSTDLNKSEREQNIQKAEEEYLTLVSEKETYTNKEIASAENDFEELKETELEKLEKAKTKEEDKFAKLKESRATSIADLRAQQKAIMKALEEKTENEVTVAERGAKKSIEDKRSETDKDIEKFKNDFENYRREKLSELNQKLNSSLNSLTEKMNLISEIQT